MDEIVSSLGEAAVFFGGLFIIIILGPLVGGVAGWVVGLLFGEIILSIAGQLGIKGVTMFQLGAFLGFIGSFLKSPPTKLPS